MESWDALATVIHKQTGRRLVGTSGGLYEFTPEILSVPYGSVEGAIHDLCHWVVASDSERRMPNLGLSTDWTHPGYDRMVKCEEMAWSLEYYLYGDISPQEMFLHMTPEAISSGGGVNSYSSSINSFTDRNYVPPSSRRSSRLAVAAEAREQAELNAEKKRREEAEAQLRRRNARRTLAEQEANLVSLPFEEAAIAEALRARETIMKHGEIRPEGTEQLRRDALKQAEAVGLPIQEIRAIVRRWWVETRPCSGCQKAPCECTGESPAEKQLRMQAKAAQEAAELERKAALVRPCTMERNGLVCDETGPHEQHRVYDVRGKLLGSWKA